MVGLLHCCRTMMRQNIIEGMIKQRRLPLASGKQGETVRNGEDTAFEDVSLVTH